MNNTLKWRCEAEDAGVRADACLCAHTELSRSRIAVLISQGALTIDGRLEMKPAAKVMEGQLL